MCVLLTVEEKAAAMESERHIEESQYTAAGDIQVTAADNPKSLSSSDVSYAIIIKYDDGYVKSKDGILRLLHVVGCSDFSLAVFGLLCLAFNSQCRNEVSESMCLCLALVTARESLTVCVGFLTPV